MSASAISLPPRQAIKAEAARRHLHAFMAQAWHVLEPATPFVDGPHLHAICDHLEAVTRGEIRNLVINMPPRHAKSLLVSVFWPVWEWIRFPERRWLFASYALSLSVRDSLKCRRLIESPWFQGLFGQCFALTSDQNAKLRFDNDRMGYRLATSVGGATTGEGGDRIVVDDPHNVNEAESDAIRQTTLRWWDEAMSTRGNDPRTVAKVIVMQRVHADDLSGHVLAQGGYEHLCLPAEYERPGYRTSIGTDWRTTEGDLLWPQRFGPAELERLRAALGPYGVAGQLQQRPAPRGGGMFERQWFVIVDALPAACTFVRYWDKAGTAGGDGARTAGVLLARAPDGAYYVADVLAARLGAPEREALIKQTAQTDRQRYGHVATWVEQEPGSGGKESAEATVRNLAGFPVYAERVTGDKALRAEPLAAQARVQNVRLLRAGWNRDYLDEVESFPVGRLKDQVDATSGAFNKLATARQAAPAIGAGFAPAAGYRPEG